MLVDKRFGVLLASALLVGGCSAFQGNTLGETKVEVAFQENAVERIDSAGKLADTLAKAGLNAKQIETVFAAVSRPLPAKMTFYDGKNKAQEAWTVDVAKGKAQYDASDVDATTVAEVKAAIAETVGDDVTNQLENAFPGGLTGLVEKIKGL